MLATFSTSFILRRHVVRFEVFGENTGDNFLFLLYEDNFFWTQQN